LEFLEGKTLPGVACLDGFDDSDEEKVLDKAKSMSFAQELKKLGV
jgi:hypothetical protein